MIFISARKNGAETDSRFPKFWGKVSQLSLRGSEDILWKIQIWKLPST